MSAFTCRDQRTTSVLIPSGTLSFHLPHFVSGSVTGLEFADLAGLVGQQARDPPVSTSPAFGL